MEEPVINLMPRERPLQTMLQHYYNRLLFDIVYYRVKNGKYPSRGLPSLSYAAVSLVLSFLGVSRILIKFLCTLAKAFRGEGLAAYLFEQQLSASEPRLLIKDQGLWVANPKLREAALKLVKGLAPNLDHKTAEQVASVLERERPKIRTGSFSLKTEVVSTLNHNNVPVRHLAVKGIMREDAGYAIITDRFKADWADPANYGKLEFIGEFKGETKQSRVLADPTS